LQFRSAFSFSPGCGEKDTAHTKEKNRSDQFPQQHVRSVLAFSKARIPAKPLKKYSHIIAVALQIQLKPTKNNKLGIRTRGFDCFYGLVRFARPHHGLRKVING
jgi:hypothetical protein